MKKQQLLLTFMFLFGALQLHASASKIDLSMYRAQHSDTKECQQLRKLMLCLIPTEYDVFNNNNLNDAEKRDAIRTLAAVYEAMKCSRFAF